MADPVESTSPASKPDPILISDEEWPDDVKARSCCGCFFFFFILWIWASVIGGLLLDELATRPINVANDKKTLTCGWQARRYTGTDGTQTTLKYPKGSTAQKAGESYIACAISIAPFLVLLTVSCCIRTGTPDEKPEIGFGPHDGDRKERFEKHQKCCNTLNKSLKIIGMLGTFILSIAAYASFSNAIGDCSSPPTGTTSAGDPRNGQTLMLLISAVVIASILIIVVVALIVLLTSENADQLGFVGGIVATMTLFQCDQGCPECNGGLDCGDAADAGEISCDGCCFCCQNS